MTVPPRCHPASSGAAVAKRPISSTVACMARCAATAAARPYAAAYPARLVASSAEHQPPLRPLAPNPMSWRSSTAMRSAGSPVASASAVHRPVNPPPTIATSTSTSAPSGAPSTRAATGSVADHSDVPPTPAIVPPSRIVRSLEDSLGSLVHPDVMRRVDVVGGAPMSQRPSSTVRSLEDSLGSGAATGHARSRR